MKISKITEEEIRFDNGSKITFNNPSSCAYNYADFLYLEDESGIFDYEFDKELDFESAPYNSGGFRFGNGSERMFFVPCYSEQNGYYNFDINIYYNNKLVLIPECDLATN